MTYPFSIPFELSPAEALRLRESAPSCAPGADVFFRVCPVCATPSWSSTTHAGTNKTLASINNEELCRPCEQVYYQHPTVFTWVVRALQARPVLNAALEKAKAAHLAQLAEMNKEKQDAPVPNSSPSDP